MPKLDPGALEELQQVESELDTRWPETKIEPSLDRISALLDVIAQPQLAYPVLHIAGTNGKSSTTRMVDALLTRIGLRTGRFTSPHLQSVTERISLDNEPISPERYVEVYRDLEPYIAMVDAKSDIKLSKFEILTAMAFAAFADAPVDAAVVEVGLGGSWDATNVADARIAVVCPIGIDHVDYLGPDILGIAREKAGIIKPNSIALLAEQTNEVARVLIERATEVDAVVARQGLEFGVLERSVAIGGQMLKLQGLGGVYDEIFLPLHGAHQAANAALALAAVEAFFGAGTERQLDVDAIREAFASVVIPGRLERLRSSPTVFVDAAHNPHGAAALAAALEDEFGFRKLVGVLGVMADKDVTGILTALEPVLTEVVVTANSSPRAMDPEQLGAAAIEIFGEDRVIVQHRLLDAIDTAVTLAETTEDPRDSMSGGGVVATGSVVTAGDVRAMFGKEPA
ncbi:dihydrofolate synthase / folylpolyglutamate synthase [Actinokineospora alba]|uniref:Dihydrofolate synthase/folylpolyglutamate synthase n=1 Tax=Actinokineospora alba TaxID=504798 RepID=A0A1H0KDT6_9PSEU|nr:folylpolyglutamate synthase/dihydrofolate synthase family protein [Actinokineospora alba]TDP67940.1 dihydrofolate synthase/folylpolyglutamate synthase [Actinokineospora alba]SDH89315.1 dihydrofolate synthase / folylpolyglutamate synthase [Actinokineospora alba]SDO54118.1 dihydrofolate synthase / folylpolyglutamate synthase [Actinokineospora alba]